MKAIAELITALDKMAQSNPAMAVPVAILLFAIAAVILAIASVLLLGRVRLPAGGEIFGGIYQLMRRPERRENEKLRGENEELRAAIATGETRETFGSDDMPFLPGADVTITATETSFRVTLREYVTVDNPNKAREFFWRLRQMAKMGRWKHFDLDISETSGFGLSAMSGLYFAIHKHLEQNGLVWRVILKTSEGVGQSEKPWKETLATMLTKSLSRESGSWSLQA